MTKSAATAVVAGQLGRALRTAGGASASPVNLTMPMPPSSNGAFRNVAERGRVLTSKARDWKAHALWHLKAQRLPLITGPVVLIFGFERSSATADVDNRVKLAIDALVDAGVIEDDRFVAGLAASWLPPANGLAHVSVLPARSMTFQFHTSQDGAAGAWIIQAPPQQEEP